MTETPGIEEDPENGPPGQTVQSRKMTPPRTLHAQHGLAEGAAALPGLSLLLSGVPGPVSLSHLLPKLSTPTPLAGPRLLREDMCLRAVFLHLKVIICFLFHFCLNPVIYKFGVKAPA